jgi:Protein kinase domain
VSAQTPEPDGSDPAGTLAPMETVELEGRRLGERYRLDTIIASGGMATVWRGTDEILNRPVAIKVLHQELSRDGELLERFRLEAVAAARLSHPSVVRVFDTGVDDGVCYIVMELFEAPTLAAAVAERGPLPPAEAAHVVRGALQGLAHAHREGIVHRDVKPSNILVDETGFVKVTDFGIAKAAFADGDVTTTGNLLGTAKYLAPEQIDGGAVDARTDLYAAGIVLYEALTGRPPFESETHLATATMRLTKAPTPPGSLRPGIPRDLEGVVLRAMARAPGDRYETADEMAAALDRSIPTSAPPAGRRTSQRTATGPRRPGWFRSWTLIPLVLVVLAGLALGGYFLYENLARGRAGPGDDGTARREPFEITDVVAFDPPEDGGDGFEYSEDAPLASDNLLGTFWQTEGYNAADMDKDGVGLAFDLGGPSVVSRIRIRTPTPGWEFEVRGSNDIGFEDAQVLEAADGETDFVADAEPGQPVFADLQPARYSHYLIWITLLPETEDGHRAQISEVDFFPPRG